MSCFVSPRRPRSLSCGSDSQSDLPRLSSIVYTIIDRIVGLNPKKKTGTVSSPLKCYLNHCIAPVRINIFHIIPNRFLRRILQTVVNILQLRIDD